jgi:hypothetical protein
MPGIYQPILIMSMFPMASNKICYSDLNYILWQTERMKIRQHREGRTN